MVKAIIFDCFGVVLTDALQLIREELGKVNPEGAEAITIIVAENNRGLIEPGESNERIASILGMSASNFRSKVAQSEVKNEQLLQYIVELRKTYKTAMLSNIAGSSLTRRFPDNELTVYFDEVIASGDIGYAKPEPEAYEIAAQRLHVRFDECVFVDDRELFCEAATSVGMHSILYTNFAQFKKDLGTVLSA